MIDEHFDIVFRDATIIDGTGAEPIQADLAISADKIEAIGQLSKATGQQNIDASEKVIAPGFIDVHTHDDNALLVWPEMTYKTSQGVTTVITGNCGISLAPLKWDNRTLPPPLDLLGEAYCFPDMKSYLQALDEAPAAINSASLCGHTTLRAGAMKDLSCAASPKEIDAMKNNLAEALNAGAHGLSTGLAYATAMPAPTSEVLELAELLGTNDALYTTHLRNEEEDIESALEEAFLIGKKANVPVVLSHHKVAGKAQFGLTKKTLEIIKRAQLEQKVHLDVYPYHASSTVIRPDRIKLSSKTLVTWSQPHPEMAGRAITDIAIEWETTEEEAAARLLPGGAIYFAMDEEDVRRVVQFPESMVASDGLPHDKKPHPRLWGTFPRVLGHYSRDLGLLTLTDAIYKMTGLPAKTFKLKKRGVLRPGNFADIVLFDPQTVIDCATFESPTQRSDGIEEVYVNGTCVYVDGESTGKKPGLALRRI